MKSNSFCFLRNIAVFITNESYVHKLHYLDFFLNLYALPIFNQNNFPSLLQLHLFFFVMGGTIWSQQ